MMFKMKRDFGFVELELEFSLEDLKDDASKGGSARLDWWLEENEAAEFFPEIARHFRWNSEDSIQSEQSLLSIMNFMAFNDQFDWILVENEWNLPKTTHKNAIELFNVMRGESRSSVKMEYKLLDLIGINLEVVSIISEIQKNGMVECEVVDYLNGLESLALAKNRDEDNYSMVDLYLSSRDFSFLLAQINFLYDRTETGKGKFLKFLNENIDLQIRTPVPYPDTEGYQILMAFTSNPPNISQIPFMDNVDANVWHHVYQALERSG
jgi:hypothetical protein